MLKLTLVLATTKRFNQMYDLFLLSVDVRSPFYLEFVTTSILFCATQIALVTIQLKLVTLVISTIYNGDPKTGLVQYLNG